MINITTINRKLSTFATMDVVMDISLCTLAQLAVGEEGIIHSFTDNQTSLKLLEMGCTPGEKIKIKYVAPLGDPIAISVSGYLLSIRKEEASTILVQKTMSNR